MIYADAGAWCAAFVPTDPDHQAANRWLDAHDKPLVTTDYVMDELMTLLGVDHSSTGKPFAPGLGRAALPLGVGRGNVDNSIRRPKVAGTQMAGL